MASNTITEQIVREAPEVEAQKLAMLAAARELVAQPQYLPAVEAVGLSPTETQAIDLAKQGIGAFEPYMQAGAQGITQGMAQQFMNPYQQQVTQNALGEMRRQADIGRQSQAAQAVGAGAFGSTREGVQRAEYDRGVADLMQQRIMQDYAQNYGQAQQSAQQSFEAQQGRQLAAGQGIGALTGQQASTDLARGQALGQFGGQMGSLGGQSQVDAIRATQLQEQMAPYQQLGFLSDIYRGAPSTQMALTAQSAPSASPLQSAVGLGVGALSTAAGAKTMGLL